MPPPPAATIDLPTSTVASVMAAVVVVAGARASGVYANQSCQTLKRQAEWAGGEAEAQGEAQLVPGHFCALLFGFPQELHFARAKAQP